MIYPSLHPSQNKTLELESSALEKDKKLLEKENKRLRQQAEIRDSKLDDNNQRISALEKENRTMGKEMIFFRDSCTRVKDLERENKELVKQATIDKKTLITLREVRLTLRDVCRLHELTDYKTVVCVVGARQRETENSADEQ